VDEIEELKKVRTDLKDIRISMESTKKYINPDAYPGLEYRYLTPPKENPSIEKKPEPEDEENMLPVQENATWSLLVHDARRLFYVEKDGKVAEEPGFFVSGIFWEKKNHRYTLYMNGVAEIGSFKSMHEVDERIKEICKTAKEPLRILEMMKHNKMKVIAECPS